MLFSNELYFMLFFFYVFCFASGALTGITVFPACPISFLIWIIFLIVSSWTFLKKHLRVVALFILFFLLGFIFSHVRLAEKNAWHLPTEKINQPVLIHGVIDSVPVTQWHQTRFVFLMREFDGQSVSAKILLSSKNHAVFQVGQRWKFQVRLKLHKNRHFKNGFDYSQWLFFHGIRAVGAIQDNPGNALLGFDKHYLLSNTREKMHDFILQAIHYRSIASFISAVSVGLRGDMKPFDWTVYQNTGTNHLIAIAGLHIGFIASAFYFLVDKMWRFFPRLLFMIPAARAAQCASFIGALGYTALSGFALPAQRASIMMICFMISHWFYRTTSIWARLWLAFLCVILLEPTELLSASLWLSFVAVALLLFFNAGRLSQSSHWVSLWKIQIVLSVGLLPITLWFFQQASWVSFLCNLIAIPWVGFIILPLTCLASLFYLCGATTVSHALFWLSGWCFWPLWQLLKNMAFWPYSHWYHVLPNKETAILCLLGIFLLLLPRGFPVRWLGLAGFLPIIFDRMIQ